MSKGLEALKNISTTSLTIWEFEKNIETIEKELTVLEIIKNQGCVSVFKERNEWFLNINGMGFSITEEQYDLLKEILE